MTASTLVSSMHHHAEGSHLATDSFELLKQNLRGHQFHNNEELETVFVYGCKCMSLIFYCNVIFLNSCQNGTDASIHSRITMKNKSYFNGMRDLHLML
jgi:hypothetical protein